MKKNINTEKIISANDHKKYSFTNSGLKFNDEVRNSH